VEPVVELNTLLFGSLLMCVPFVLSQSGQPRTKALEEAASLIQKGDLAAAEEFLQSLLKQTSDDALALNLLGVVRLQQHQSKEAAELFEAAIRTGRKLAGPHINLALVYGENRPLEAIGQIEAALKISPGNGQAASLLRQIVRESAGKAMQAGKKDSATDILKAARSILPNDPELLYDSGFLAYECDSYQDADRYLTEALKLRRDYPEATYALARTYLAENEADAAEHEMQTYLAARPEDATAQYGLGYILMAEQKVKDAKIAFERSNALRPEQTESTYQLGEIALQEGQNEVAEADFKKVLARDPHHAGALTELAILAYRQGKYDDAKAGLERAIASAPQYQKAHYYYALTLAKLGQKTDAEREFAVSRTLQKQHGGGHQLLATQP
jgi:tetratricopeptide (TPR) repeat protein